MSMLDVFNNDIFGMISLTAAINKLPQQPSKLGDMGLFKQQPVNTTVVSIEERNGKLALVQTSPRGSRTLEQPHAKRKVRAFTVPHLSEYDSIKAEEVQGIRDFGNPGSPLQAISTVVNNRLEQMKRNIEATREWHRATAIQGLIKDADGSTIYDLYAEFGVSQPTAAFYFGTNTTEDCKVTAQKINRQITFALGMTPFSGVQAICGDDFWDAMIASPSVKDAYKYAITNEMLRTVQRDGFDFAGIRWWNYTCKIGSTFVMPTAEAYFLPAGVPDLFVEYLAPADYIETVNTMGQEYYAKQEIQPFGKGIDLEAQCNPLNIVTRPACIVKGTYVTS